MNNERFFIMRSQTTAIKAKRLLLAHGFACSIFKSTSVSGCAYTVSVLSTDYASARSVLTKAGIEFADG